ncbi:MAG: flagellar basal body rod protein FlgB [Clostridium sp.]|nr:flagellar basal body rod protein FlgB [Clostridium sp.]
MIVGDASQGEFTYDLIKQGLNASSTRGEVIANNIANINTAGYKRRYVTFESTLQDSMDNISMKKDNPKHMDAGDEYGSINVQEDDTGSMRTDGNNVDINTEMSNQAQNTLMYQTLTNQANSRINMAKSVINGGN